MNDKASAEETAAFDPATAGWKLLPRTGFGDDLAGPLWRKDDTAFGFVAAAKHLNLNNVLHGGMMCTLVDQAMGMTAMRASGGKKHATIELSVQFVGAVRRGEFVEAHCEVVRVTRAIIFMRAKVVVGTRTVGMASGVWKISDES
jgi:uncharacterized protein (TIGR00369 family)